MVTKLTLPNFTSGVYRYSAAQEIVVNKIKISLRSRQKLARFNNILRELHLFRIHTFS